MDCRTIYVANKLLDTVVINAIKIVKHEMWFVMAIPLACSAIPNHRDEFIRHFIV